MPYIANTPVQIEEMLKTLGFSSPEELFSNLPSSIKINGKVSIPSGLSEAEVRKVIKAIAKKNKPLSEFNSFLGAGVYYHYLPSALKYLFSRPEFYTAYTPYQPECSQGSLQAIFEYQTYICLLTGMDITNASFYDGASAVAEAVLMSLRIGKKKKILVSRTMHPEYQQTIKTYLRRFGFLIREIPSDNQGFLDLDILKQELDDKVVSLSIQSPNFFGLIEDIEEISKLLRERGILFIQVTNPVSLALLKEPSKLGVDIVCGDGQPLGGTLSLGGPGFGFLATKKDFLRQLPGRIVGKTKDREGKDGFCLTLQTREQHIRREKATSNICSNHSLNTIGAAIYLSLLGKEGLKKVALYSLNLTRYLHRRMKEIDAIKVPFSERFFNEFVWRIDNADRIIKKLHKKNIIAGFALKRFYPEFRNHILSCCTEIKTKEEIDVFIRVLKGIISA